MILTDAKPIVAIIDPDDPYHAVCNAVLRRLSDDRLITTWPCITKAMHWLGRAGGYPYQARIWDLYHAAKLFVHQPSPAETDRMARLMAQYHDTPMDLADASLIAAAENLGHRRIFTVDLRFYFYRLNDGATLEVVPGGDERLSAPAL